MATPTGRTLALLIDSITFRSGIIYFAERRAGSQTLSVNPAD